MGALVRAGLRGQARRLVSAGLAVGLGVMFLAITLLLSDTLSAVLEKDAAGEIGSYSVVVTVPEDSSAVVDEAVVDKVRGVAGVTSVEPIARTVAVLGSGHAIELATAPPEGRATYVRGRAPRARGEVALTEAGLAALGTDVGKTVPVPEGTDGLRSLTVVGVVEAGPETAVSSAMPAGVATNATLAPLIGDAGYSELRIVGAATAAAPTVRDAVASAVGPDLRVLTGEDDVQRRVQELAGGHDLVTRVVVVFATVALFTCVIVVANTFTILLAQRQRQLALMRCIGAGRGQLVRAVVVEGVVLGAIASVAGVLTALAAVWIGLAVAHTRVPDIVPADAPAVTPLALVVPLAVGLVLTVAAAIWPAVRATRTSPLAALRPELPPAGRVRLVRVVLGVVAALAGLVLLVLGVQGGRLELGILGGVVSFAGVFALGPVVVPPLVGIARGLARATVGAPGVMAVENARRNPQRAAATTSALLVGVTLITMMTVGATITRQVASDEITGHVPVDAVAQSLGTSGLDAEDVRRLRSTEGIVQVAEVSTMVATFVGRDDSQATAEVTAVGSGFRDVLRAPAVVDGLKPGTVLLDAKTASSLQVATGDRITAPWGPMTVAVAGVGTPVVLASDATGEGPVQLWLRFDDDADVETVGTALNRTASTMDGIQVTSTAAQRAEIESAVEVVLMVALALLAVAVLIALVGVGNTLGLSVLERTRESALLRALGLTRGQLRGMLGVEAVVLSAVAVALGVALGIGYGWAGIATLLADIPDDGVPLLIPWTRVGLIAAVALGAGLLASVLPARRAARVAPAAALAGE